MSLRDRFIQQVLLPSARIAGVLACATLSIPALAQTTNPNTIPITDTTPGKRPASAGRVVRAFDFEEQDINPLPVPLGWFRAQEDPNVPRVRPGFPIWNKAKLDYRTPAYSGIGSVVLPTKGGSTSLELRHGEINIFPDADYLVSVRIRTQGLKHAKARLVARLLDAKGEQIDDAKFTTQLVNSQDHWEQVSLEIEGIYPDAAFMQIELELLQPKAQHESRTSDTYTVFEQDFDGAAWFDNLIIAQLPRLNITTATPGNIVESESAPPLKILVRDLTGDAIDARIRVFDVHGQPVDEQLLSQGKRRVRTDWTPKLPGFGWYHAMLEVTVDRQLVGIRTLDFIWSSPNESNPDSGMFGIATKLTNPKIARSTPTLIRGSGVTRAAVELWNYTTTKQDLEPGSPPMHAINELLSQGTELSITLGELPKGLADTLALDPGEVMPLFAGPSSAWVPWGSTMLDEFGQAVLKWRFGDRPTEESAQTLKARIDAIDSALTGYVPGPIPVIPWAIDRPIDQAIIAPNTELLVIDNNTTNEHAMELIVDDWAQAASTVSTKSIEHPPMLGMVLSPMHEPGEWSGVEVWSSVGVLARKAISFWWQAQTSPAKSAQFDLQLKDAWWVSAGKRAQVMPAPELVVWRALATQLANRHAVRELDLIPGVRMLLAGPKPDQEEDSSGILILWLEDPTLDPVILNLPLAMGTVTQRDVFDNQTPIELKYITDLKLPVHQIEIGRSPIIIEGVNTQLVEFLNALKLTPDKLQAESGVHKHALTISNPWPFTIRGRIFIVEPGGYTSPTGEIDRSWEIEPRVYPFTLNANEQKEVPIEIAYSLGEIAGEKQLAFDVELQGDKDYPLMRVNRTINLGLDTVEMSLTARRSPDAITIVTVKVNNKLDTDQDFEVIAIPPNEPRLRRSINAIKPNETVTREFAFTKVNPGDRVIVALILRDSSIRLNQAITIP